MAYLNQGLAIKLTDEKTNREETFHAEGGVAEFVEYLDRSEDLALYEYDGSVDKHRPDLVVFPRTTEEVD